MVLLKPLTSDAQALLSRPILEIDTRGQVRAGDKDKSAFLDKALKIPTSWVRDHHRPVPAFPKHNDAPWDRYTIGP